MQQKWGKEYILIEVLQQGFNQVLTGATFILRQIIGSKSMSGIKLNNKKNDAIERMKNNYEQYINQKKQQETYKNELKISKEHADELAKMGIPMKEIEKARYN